MSEQNITLGWGGIFLMASILKYRVRVYRGHLLKQFFIVGHLENYFSVTEFNR